MLLNGRLANRFEKSPKKPNTYENEKSDILIWEFAKDSHLTKVDFCPFQLLSAPNDVSPPSFLIVLFLPIIFLPSNPFIYYQRGRPPFEQKGKKGILSFFSFEECDA